MSQENIQFQHDGKVIDIRKSKQAYVGNSYIVYPTYFQQYFIKCYNNDNMRFNVKMAENFIESSKKLIQKDPFAICVYEKKQKFIKYYILIKAYSKNLQQLIDLNFFSNYLHLFKFIHQIAHAIKNLQELNLIGFQINQTNIVQDIMGNFEITHLDINLNQKNDFDDLIQELLEQNKYFAPEMKQENQYCIESNIWDLGILIFQILFKSSPNINYAKKEVEFNIENFENQKIINILQNCLKWNKEERISVEDLINEINMLVNNFDELRITNTQNNNEIKLENTLSYFDYIYQNENFDNFELVQTNQEELDAKNTNNNDSKIQILLWNKYMINNKILEELIKNGWKNPNNHIKFYHEIIDRLKIYKNDDILRMKILIILHSYIFRSNKQCLIIFLQENSSKNMIEEILDMIINDYKSKYWENNILVSYALILKKKYEFCFKHIKLIEPNLSIHEVDLQKKWQNLIQVPFIIDLFEYYQSMFAFLIYFKQINLNYFETNILFFVSKEYHSSLSLLMNVLILIEIIASNREIESASNENDHFQNYQNQFFQIFEQNRRATDLIFKQFGINNKQFQIYLIERNLKKEYDSIKEVIQQILEKSKSKFVFDPKLFFKNFKGLIIKMPFCSMQKRLKIPKQQQLSKENTQTLLKQYIESIRLVNFKEFIVLSLLPNIQNQLKNNIYYISQKKAIYQKFHLINKEKDKSTKNLEIKKEIKDKDLEKSNMVIVENKQHNIDKDIQVEIENDIQKSIEAKKEEIINLQNQLREKLNKLNEKKSKLIEKSQVEENQKSLKNSMLETNNDLNDLNQESIEKFILREFQRCVDERIIDFNEIVFLNLISEGSQSQIHRGKYKNNEVAIKKITGGKQVQQIKFLKEFKRELSILVSLPSHKNLINFLGFCINNDEIYIVTQYCSGGNLFDIFYRNNIPFKLSYSQKLKILLDISIGMQFLHELKNPIIHRDLKTLK